MNNKIILQIKGRVGTILLNNPKKLNAFDYEMIKELDESLEKIRKSDLKAVLMKGSGSSFCTGGDIYWEKEVGNLNTKRAKKQLKFLQTVFSKIEKLPQIFIAVLHGYIVGGGNELAMACDIRVALPSAEFIHPETTLGTVAPLGATKRLPRLIGLGRAKYMLFTGDRIGSKTALEWNLVDFVFSEEKIHSFLNSLLSKITKNSAKALALTKKSVNKNYMDDLSDNFEINSYIQCSKTKENKEILNRFLGKSKKTF